MLAYWPPMLVPGSPFMLLYAALPDLINGLFELCGGFFILFSVVKLYRDKIVKGVSWVHVAFFSSWGFWNLFYYPHLDQWLSFYGGLWIVTVNCIWLGQIAYYSLRPAPVYIEDVEVGDVVPLTISAAGLKTERFRHSDK